MDSPRYSEGLITRFGRWLDWKFKAKATQEDLIHYFNLQENAAIKDKIELQEKIGEVRDQIQNGLVNCMELIKQTQGKEESDVFGLRKAITDLTVVVQAPSEVAKSLDDLKTRMEKMELYSGMTRKVDPTKPPVVKSAFQM
jgi:hypothetical protein